MTQNELLATIIIMLTVLECRYWAIVFLCLVATLTFAGALTQIFQTIIGAVMILIATYVIANTCVLWFYLVGLV